MVLNILFRSPLGTDWRPGPKLPGLEEPQGRISAEKEESRSGRSPAFERSSRQMDDLRDLFAGQDDLQDRFTKNRS